MRFHLYAVLIQDIKELLEQGNITMNHTPRERNQRANFLVKLGASSNFEFLCHESSPSDRLNFLWSDASETFYLRVCFLMPTITSYFGFLLAVLTITFLIMSIANSWSLRFTVNTNSYLRIDITPTFFPFNQTQMIEVSLFGIVLGLIPITLAGLFVTAYLQYRRGDQLDI
ncbi:cytochrome b6-F complex subunit 5 [Medicago truncatula]|uniref:Cytochrome b6-F complex subunit 5 n=56 Tax=Spermatophyta TaxID=58024 RepID=G7L7R5_MEDTR|nr:cytochrome b6-F complex subunit 5 [Medicago truncatula]